MTSIIVKGKTAIPAGTIEDFKRPVHEDFATGKELADREFSGIRNNSITNHCEIWILGNLHASMDSDYKARYPEEWNELYEMTFGLKMVEEVTQSN